MKNPFKSRSRTPAKSPVKAGGPSERILIVNADDFGRTRAVNAGVIEAHEHGIVTSASLMVRWPAVREAAEYCRDHPALAAGLHLDLGEWVLRGGHWVTVYEVADVEGGPSFLLDEVKRQLEQFRRLMDRDPTHLDSHQHVHTRAVTGVFRDLAAQLGVPLREHHAAIGFCGAFYGQTADGQPLHRGIEPDYLIEVIGALEPGVTELACHPGAGGDGWSVYEAERAIEVATLCDERVRAAIGDAGVQLRSFADLRTVGGA